MPCWTSSDRWVTTHCRSRAKAQMKSAWLFGQETYHGLASQWGFYSILGRPKLVKTYLKHLEEVTLQDLTNLLRIYFGSRELSGAVVMPNTSS